MLKPEAAREKFLDTLFDQASVVEGLANAVDFVAGNSLDHEESIHHATQDATVLRFLVMETHQAARRLCKMIEESTRHG